MPAETGGSTITGYMVQCRLPADTDYPSSSTTITTTGATITGFAPAILYDVRVTAVDDIGTGEWLTDRGSKALVAPQVPTSLEVAVAS